MVMLEILTKRDNTETHLAEYVGKFMWDFAIVIGHIPGHIILRLPLEDRFDPQHMAESLECEIRCIPPHLFTDLPFVVFHDTGDLVE